MAEKLVVGLFETKGVAEDACNRLRYDGVPAADMRLWVLHDIAPTPPYVEAEFEALSVDPMVLGNVRDTYAPYISNGETVLFVLTRSEVEVDRAVDTIKQYAPMQVMVTPPCEIVVDNVSLREPRPA